MTIDKPKLSAILSTKSISFSVFLVGNNTKIRMYPGMKRIKGKPRMILVIPSILSSAAGINMKLHNIHIMISIGCFLNVILIFQSLDVYVFYYFFLLKIEKNIYDFHIHISYVMVKHYKLGCA